MTIMQDKILGMDVGLLAGLPLMVAVLFYGDAPYHAMWVAALMGPVALVAWARLHPHPVEVCPLFLIQEPRTDAGQEVHLGLLR